MRWEELFKFILIWTTYNSKFLLCLGGPLVPEFLKVVGGQTEVDELVVLNVFGVLVVDLSSLEIIVGVLSITVNTHNQWNQSLSPLHLVN